MLRKIFLLIILTVDFVSAQTYCAGDQISLEHQNEEQYVGAGYDGYETGDTFKLADYNGDLNGGDYHVILIDMGASWCGPCVTNVPIVDALEEQFLDSGVKFIMVLADVGQPYTSEEWQDLGVPDTPMVIDDDMAGSFGSSEYISLFHDSFGGAIPTFVLIDHTMTVRAKPWTLDSNSNSDSCDGSNSTVYGWSGGSTASFIQQLVDECGVLCEPCQDTTDTDGDGIGDECDDCHNLSGDVNDDFMFNVLDIVTVVNMILSGGISSPDFEDCAKMDADMNGDGQVNILDVIRIINLILANPE